MTISSSSFHLLVINLMKLKSLSVTTFVRTCDGDTTDFPINIGLHQGSALSPYLFALVMDEITKGYTR